MAVSEGAKAKESNMQFVVSKQNLQRELGFVQGIVERKNTIPVLSNILIEAVGETTIRITGTDLEATIAQWANRSTRPQMQRRHR